MFASAVVAAALAPGAAPGDSPDASAQLVVHVRDGNGRPIPLAWVAVWAGNKATWSRVREGKVSLSRAGLHDGSASVEVFGAAVDRDAPLPWGAWRGPLPSGATEITARLGVERRIDGFVRDAQGRGIEAALVRAFPEDGEWDPRGRLGGPHEWHCIVPGEMPEEPAGWAHAQVRTGSDGAFSLGRLAEVRYALWVEGPPDTLATPPVRVRAPASGVVVSLTSGASPTVTVLDESGKPIADAVVWAQDETGVPLRPTPPGRGRFTGFIERTSPRGDATLRGLDPDRRVLLDVRPPDGDTRRLPVRIRDWLPGELTVRIDEGRRVTVDVRELDGMPAAKAWVQGKSVEVQWKNAEDPHDPWRAAEASGDGAFVTGNVRSAARVALRARIRQDGKPRHYRSAAAVVPAGATKAALTLAPSPSLRVFVEGARPEERVEVEIGDESVAGFGRSQGRSAPAGEAVFNDLWPGTTYAVRAQGSGGRRAWTQGTPADAGEVRVKLEAGLTARGHVDGPAGLSVESVVARVWGFHVLGTAAGGSSFEIAGLPPGPFFLEVTLRDSHGNPLEAHGRGVPDGENTLELRPR